MSAKHTQGPLVLGQYGAIRGGPMVRFINGSAQEQLAMTTVASWMGPGEHLANARRLVACWNACEGISTDRLEDLGRPLMNHLIGCDERAARMVKEREDLQAQVDHFQALAKDNGSVIVKTACDLGAMRAQRDDLLAALKEERRIRLLGQSPDVHWESIRDIRRDAYAATEAAIAKAEGIAG